ncbi:MAG TPA: hypothetical protein VGE72_20885 [Azospirillum sp.]
MMDEHDILYPDGWHWEKSALTYGIDPAVASWTPWVAAALERWDLASGLSFAPAAPGATPDIAVTTLAAVDAPADAIAWSGFWTADAGTAIVHGFIGLSPAQDPGAMPPGKALWMALHEAGHALGLSHPHGHRLGDAGDQSLTVMSYNPPPDGGMPDRPMPLDVAAVQSLYGPDHAMAAPGDGLPLSGGPGYDVLEGSLFADVLYGNEDPDVLYGLQGDDALYGGRDADTLFGGQGADALFGGAGDDLLAGGLGADRFVFGPLGGRDVILDFDPAAGDRLLAWPDAAPVAVATPDGVRLDFADGSGITLLGVDPARLPPGWLVPS